MENATKSVNKLFCSIGSPLASLTEEDLTTHIDSFLESVGERRDILLIPPDFTRYHSQAGKITQIVCDYYQITKNDVSPQKKAKTIDNLSCLPSIEIIPALGTHAPMNSAEIRTMFGDQLAEMDPTPFRIHDWRNGVVTIGETPAEMVKEATGGLVERPWPAQLNKIIWDRRLSTQAEQEPKSLILSIGQVVPHEVMGMANFNKNIFVGTGGTDAINLSHFIGAVIGMERVMGRKTNPLRDILNYASEKYLHSELDLWYILTVVSPDPCSGDLAIRGLYIGKDVECYLNACDLSLKVNFILLEKPVKRMVVYLEPGEFHSTWLGNKAIYRTRMAMADDGDLIILAPGVERFGEDGTIDELIRKFGYKGTPIVMKMMEENEELQLNLSAVAHLIHGSTEGRFRVTYCPGHLSREEIEQVGFQYAELSLMSQKYNVMTLRDGWNKDSEGDFYFVKNPALGLWATEARFAESS